MSNEGTVMTTNERAHTLNSLQGASEDLRRTAADVTEQQAEEEGVRGAVEELLREERELGGRRAFPRDPFFRSVTLTPADGIGHQWSASTRDISWNGVGLLSGTPVERGKEVIITIPRTTGEAINLKTEMLWCAPFGDGWYIIGGRFLELVDSAANRLDVRV